MTRQSGASVCSSAQKNLVVRYPLSAEGKTMLETRFVPDAAPAPCK
jgi:hypothetical protein